MTEKSNENKQLHPTFPMMDKFTSILDARRWSEKFVSWYNNKHLHSALKFVTPEQRHTGADRLIRAHGHQLYQQARALYPERWTGKTRNWALSDKVRLNPDKKNKSESQKASSDDLITQQLRLVTELLEQERPDGAGDGSRQTANAVRQHGHA